MIVGVPFLLCLSPFHSEFLSSSHIPLHTFPFTHSPSRITLVHIVCSGEGESESEQMETEVSSTTPPADQGMYVKYCTTNLVAWSSDIVAISKIECRSF